MSQDKVIDLPTEGLEPSTGHSEANKDTQTSSIDSLIEEILDDAFERGLHFCSDTPEDGECWRNAQAHDIVTELTELITRLTTESKIELVEELLAFPAEISVTDVEKFEYQNDGLPMLIVTTKELERTLVKLKGTL